MRALRGEGGPRAPRLVVLYTHFRPLPTRTTFPQLNAHSRSHKDSDGNLTTIVRQFDIFCRKSSLICCVFLPAPPNKLLFTVLVVDVVVVFCSVHANGSSTRMVFILTRIIYPSDDGHRCHAGLGLSPSRDSSAVVLPTEFDHTATDFCPPFLPTIKRSLKI